LFAQLFFRLLNNGETVFPGLKQFALESSNFLAIVEPLIAIDQNVQKKLSSGGACRKIGGGKR